MTTKLYKTISAAGASIHGGSLQWSMPTDGQPGEWHEVMGEIVKCCVGLHLTDEPARWWSPGCRVFEAEAWDSSSVVARGSSSVVAMDSVTVISWRGRPGTKIMDRVVWIDRSSGAPTIYVADSASAPKAP